MDERRIQVGDNEIACFTAGEGPPVLLLHGLVGDHRAWAPTIGRLTARYLVIAPDNRGAGHSTQRDEPITFQEMAADMVSVLDALGIDRAHVIGRSTGGGMALCLALDAPERTASIACLASFARPNPMTELCGRNMRESLEWSDSWVAFARHALPYFVTPQFMRDQPERCQAILSIIGCEDRLKACYHRQNQANFDFDVSGRLGEIRCPTLVAAGSQDPLCGPISAHELAQGIPGAELEMFHGRSHFFLMEEPERFNALLDDWLDRQAGAARPPDPGP